MPWPLSALPVLSRVAERLYDAIAPLVTTDEDEGYAAAIYAQGYAKLLDPVSDLVSDDEDGVPGWANHLFAPDTEPSDWLPVTEAYVGVVPYPAVDDAGRRLRIKQTDGRYRGTRAAIKGAARQFLVGPDGTPESATVFLTARLGGVATSYAVATLDAETPDPDLVEAALLEQKPAGFNMTYAAVTGGDWTSVTTTHVDWAEVLTDFATWSDVRNDPAHT
jgi:hypothetical protein